MTDIRILHAQETQAFACRVAAALAADGHSVMRHEAGAAVRPTSVRSAEPLVVVWSPQMLANEAAINEARAAHAGRRLVPVAVGRIDPPASFAHLPPIDLAGWTGDAEDSRWRFVCEEIELALRHKATARAELYGDDEEETTEIDPENPYILPVRTIAGVAAGLALVAIAVVTAASFAGPGREKVAAGEPTQVLAKLTAAPEQQVETDADAPAERRSQTQAEPARDPAPEFPPAAARLSELEPDPRETAPSDADQTLPGALATLPDESIEPQNADPSAERLTPPAEALADSQQEPASEDAPVDSDENVSGVELAEAEALRAPPPVKLPPMPVDDFLGVVFRDCLDCPDMVEAPAGAFSMGASEDDPAASAAESPAQVEMVARFAIARREVTFAQWDACVAAGGCRAYAPSDEGFGRGARPVINVSYADAERYAQWLSARTGHAYRLPSEAEWEYAARAGAPTPYVGGAALSPQRANYDGALKSDEDEPVSLRMTTPTGSYPANGFGLYDAMGNVREWTADCWTASHDAAANADCSARVVKGGAYDSGPAQLRPAHRTALAETAREPVTGFRVVRDLD
ncbi:MAG: SUMF1/EgtB/PvdO family nonheme iron enzyme [Amphiplicatus sp.]